jgi:betaine-homocysteine S-methyltransferase
VQAGPYTPEVTLEHPQVLEQLHLEFVRAGSQVLQALTFYASEEKLEASGHSHFVEEINRAAVRIAKRAAGGACLVAGVITLTPSFEPGSERARRRVRALLDQQVGLQKSEGVDFFIGETFCSLEEALIALEAIKASELPAMLTMNLRESGSAEGYRPAECARRLAGAGADVVGINCNYDPTTSLRIVEQMRRAVDVHIACQPVAFATSRDPFFEHECFPLSLERVQLSRFELARFAKRAQQVGVGFIGGCCGVQACHIRSMAEALGRRPVGSAKSPQLERHVLPQIRMRQNEGYWHAATR